MRALRALVLLAGCVAVGRAGLCDAPFNKTTVKDVIAQFGLQGVDDIQGVLACTYNSSELFYDLMCGVEAPCSKVADYFHCVATVLRNKTFTDPFPIATALFSVQSLKSAFNCSEPVPQIFAGFGDYARPAGAIAALPLSYESLNDTCQLQSGPDTYSVLALSGVLRNPNTGVFGFQDAHVELRATICPQVWSAPACNSESNVALCRQTSTGGVTYETSLGATLVDAYLMPQANTLTLVYEDSLSLPSTVAFTGSASDIVSSLPSVGPDLSVALVASSFVQSWVKSAQTGMRVRGYVHLHCDPTVDGEPALSNVSAITVSGLYEIQHVTISHRCACANASCPVDLSQESPIDCSEFQSEVPDAFLYAALGLTGLFIAIERRKWHAEILFGRIGVPIPFNLLEDRSHTLSTAFIFCAASALLFSFVFSLPEAPSPYLKTLYTLFFSVREALILYPLFLCNTCRVPWFGCMTGLAFTLALAVYFARGIDCFRRQADPVYLPAPSYLETIVTFGLALYFGYHFAREVLARLSTGKRVKIPISKIGTPTQLAHLALYEPHVKRLLEPRLRRSTVSAPTGLKLPTRLLLRLRQRADSFWTRWILRRDSFHYGGRLIIAVGICVVFLVLLITSFVELMNLLKNLLESFLYSGADAACTNRDPLAFAAQVQDGFGLGFGCHIDAILVDSLVACFKTAIVLTTFVQLFALYYIMDNYHNQLLRLYRGDTRFLPESHPDSAVVVANAVRFTGFFIGYFLTGCIVIFFATLMMALIVTGLMVLPLYGLYGTFIWSFLAQQIPVVVIGLLFFFAQIFVVRYVFLRRSNQSDLSLKHRNVFHNYEFFLLIFNIISGAVSYIVRFLIFGFLTLVTFSRLDKSFFIQGFEWSDPGYRTYISCLLLDAYYSNPVLITFARILIERNIHAKSKSDAASSDKGDLQMQLLSFGDGDVQYGMSASSFTLPSRRAKARWHLAYTLIFNPDLIKQRCATSIGKSRWFLDAAQAVLPARQPSDTESGSQSHA